MTMQDANMYQALHPYLTGRANDTLLITAQKERYTYGNLERDSARLAGYMTELGVSPGDRVSVQVEKTPLVLCLYIACLRAGFVFHPINIAYQSAEMAYFLSDAEPALLVCDSRKLSELEPIAEAAGVSHLLTLDADDTGSLTERSRASRADFANVPRAKNDLAALLYSSGTTGVPKGIMLTHENLLSSAQTLVAAWGFTSKDCLLHALPIFHVHGLFVAFGCVLLSGASMRWLPSFNAGEVLRCLPECTVMMGVPTYYTRLLDSPLLNAETCANIRLFISGSAPLLEETFVDFEKQTTHRILERYGMTETNMNTSNPLHGVRKPGTVGPPLPSVEVQVVDDDGQPLPAGEIGNLLVKGPNVFKGYWKLPDKTAEDFNEAGFFNTGDQARIDQDGYVSIVGRTKDLVITGGMNVYPKEVELVIDDLPNIKESAVIGVPHADFGEAVVAVVVASTESTLDENKIINLIKGLLANFKIPKRVIFVEELPRNSMGKVQKNRLREEYKTLLA